MLCQMQEDSDFKTEQ